jgi:hypothetical protein
MEIKDILNKLGIDLSNPEAKRGALEAIDAILASRTPMDGMGSGGSMPGMNKEVEVELDPDLLQPSIKQAPAGTDDEDIEIEDEEKILDQIKHNDSEEPIQNNNSKGNDSKSSEDSDSSQDTERDDTDSDGTTDNSENDNADQQNSDNGSSEKDELKNSTEDEESPNPDDLNRAGDNTGSDEDSEDSEGSGDSEDLDDEELDGDSSFEGSGKGDSEDIESDDGTEAEGDFEDGEATVIDSEDDEEDDDEEEDEEYDFEFDEDDFLDDELKNSTEDEEIKTKHDARKIKRERTLAAAKATLADAQAKKVSPALIRELEKSIEALEALTEAVTKSLKDISDEEFNMLINRALDAIQACGDSGLTITSDEERAAQVKEIKDDLAKAETQNELSAEDIAKIRAETQAVKAREKEADKYKKKAAGSFKGFQEFLNSLYRAIALQVSNEETRDDTWSAISRRNSGAGVLRQGQRVNDLPNKRIPIIDFYFDTSTSWDADDIKVGMKAVSQLADMEEKGQIKLNIFYFADEVSTRPTRGTTSGWNEIVKNVIATQATNVVIMTDSDMQNWWTGPRALKYTVPGYVWYLWKNGSNAPRLPQDLKGRGGVQQFSFNIGDV